MSWQTFLAVHWDGLGAADFFTVEVLTRRGFVRCRLLPHEAEDAHGGDRPDDV